MAICVSMFWWIGVWREGKRVDACTSTHAAVCQSMFSMRSWLMRDDIAVSDQIHHHCGCTGLQEINPSLMEPFNLKRIWSEIPNMLNTFRKLNLITLFSHSWKYFIPTYLLFPPSSHTSHTWSRKFTYLGWSIHMFTNYSSDNLEIFFVHDTINFSNNCLQTHHFTCL